MSWMGLLAAGGYMAFIAILYVTLPSLFIAPFQATTIRPSGKQLRIVWWCSCGSWQVSPFLMR